MEQTRAAGRRESRLRVAVGGLGNRTLCDFYRERANFAIELCRRQWQSARALDGFSAWHFQRRGCCGRLEIVKTVSDILQNYVDNGSESPDGLFFFFYTDEKRAGYNSEPFNLLRKCKSKTIIETSIKSKCRFIGKTGFIRRNYSTLCNTECTLSSYYFEYD